MCEEEQTVQMTKELPTIEQYIHRRMGSSAVEVCLAIQEYCLGITIPSEVMRCEAMSAIWHETNIIISTMNDMMSIKKEVDNSQIDSLIPLLFIQVGSVQKAIDRAAEMTTSAVQRFERAERDIKIRYGADPVLLSNLTRFIDGCKYACTGNMNWSLTSGRYKLGVKHLNESITLVL
ncbi:putative terpene synthase metal binding domain protein [Rosellinia necatrix]|uniref:Terpene synthase n=1 Tax=Rosellinia necatrix TaxID=77044 RepID=A0A1W2TWV9_ROSNE|nr:putative terpene synthase metal binding domain protein [Rosellinia necatrix]